MSFMYVKIMLLFLHWNAPLYSGPYLGFFVCGGKLGFREISDQYSYKKQPSKIRHYVRKKTFSFPGGGNCPLRPPAMYGPVTAPFIPLKCSESSTNILTKELTYTEINFLWFCCLPDFSISYVQFSLSNDSLRWRK